ncbi:anaphase-promoting complex subunit cdc27 [Serendipita sp. 396]|nr:anaphase-promoting complex subunit cdc27 [Serendipita sp. 396]KAG8827478.1 anaphase-promoting complex subunit cdc27 [Serendipita sp. 401]KAG8873555.1 anaphase-promoting complex subunit cdc27 [Serendipita sp. 405]KAG9056165.1 anaphase-promoting complex subunit cdc27 [Serendipita sp. 407]
MSGVDATLVAQRLTTLIHRYLDAELLKTALFYAERLFAMDGTNHDSRHLLANVMLKLDQPHSALHLATRPQDEPCAGCLYIAARCNEKLQRPGKSKDLMSKALHVMSNSSRDRLQFAHQTYDVPEPAILYCKAGLTAAKASQRQEAIDNFYHALKLEPLLWDAWQGLCTLGATVDVEEALEVPSHLQGLPSAFPDNEESATPVPSMSHPIVAKLSKQYAITPTLSKPPGLGGGGDFFFTPDQKGPSQTSSNYQLGSIPKGKGLYNQALETPDPHTPLGSLPALYKSLNIGTRATSSQQPPSIPGGNQYAGTRRTTRTHDDGAPPNKRVRTTTGRTAVQSVAKSTTLNPPSTTAARRSTRLLMSNGKANQVKHPGTSKDGQRKAMYRSRSVSDADDTTADAPSPSSGSIPQSPPSDSTENINVGSTSSQDAKYNEAVADRYVFDLMKILAQAQYNLSRYQCRAAIGSLEKLPQNQQMAPSVMIMYARAYYELVEYTRAERAFKMARRFDPYRVWDMDMYSTLLWHLRKNAQLSFLAQELLNINPKSPEAWIAIGNCFSLQKEHPQALVSFQRASEMDPFCAYAYTLSGHESLVSDDVRKAIVLFQTALGYDGRHYNAWYGLGSCYLKMGRLPMAQYHFERAVEIHPANAVLLGCLGMVHERQGRVEEALSLFNIALQASPNNSLVRYRRAKIMVQRGDYAAAEEDLVRLCDLSPSEPNVVLLLGKVYHLQGKKEDATRVLAVARDLDPRNAPKIEKLVEESTREREAAATEEGIGGGETSVEGASESALDVSMEG